MLLKNRFHEDINTLHVGTEENRAYYIPYGDSTKALARNWMDCDRLFLLSGDDWEFSFHVDDTTVPTDFMQPGGTPIMDKISVPSTWNMLGYEGHQYTNVRFPFPYDPPYIPRENSCGTYRKEFVLDKDQASMRQYLNFEGVDSSFYVWINGEFVGYSMVSHSTSEFEITQHMKEGKNTLAVLVYKWCHGSYLEDQDKLRMSGIFRDVYLIGRPQTHIRDYFVHATPLEDNKGKLEVIFDGAEGLEISAELFCPVMDLIGKAVVKDGKLLFDMERADRWTAERPTLFTLIITAGKEIIVERVGFRSIVADEKVLKINGQALKFKGINRHDSNAYTGYTISREQALHDLTMMKEHNVNAIRTSHYPSAPWFYQLCDEYGFYVIDESDIEAHGAVTVYGGGAHTYSELARKEEYAPSIVDRVQRCVVRDQNRPSVVMWSLGNEAGYGLGFEQAAKWTKEYDPSRLVHYESARDHIRAKDAAPWDTSNLDVHSEMYTSTTKIRELLTGGDIKVPYILCEYVHAMGNGPGDIEDYNKIIYEYDQFCGGFVWEWTDHSVYMGKHTNGKDKFFYGGNWGEFPHDGNFCMDGLVYPDRSPHTGFEEFKNGIRPVRAYAKDLSKGTISFENRLDYLDLTNYATGEYVVITDGVEAAPTAFAFDSIPPRKTNTQTLDFSIPADGESTLLIRYFLKEESPLVPKNHLLGFDQIPLTQVEWKKKPSTKKASVQISESEKTFVVVGDQFRYVFDRWNGIFSEIVHQNKLFLEKPMEWNIWRAPTDNDRNIKKEWQEAGYDRITTRVYGSTIKTSDTETTIHATLSIGAIFIQRILDLSVTWTIDATGKIGCSVDGVFDPTNKSEETKLPFLPRFGIRMFLPKSFDQLEYYGYGPYESYQDKHLASYLGRFSSTVAGEHEDYIVPQENGSHWDCRDLTISGASGGVEVKAVNKPFSFNASPYTQEELTEKTHNYLLEESGHTVVCLDYIQSGIGSNSCGPQLLEQYRLQEKNFNFSIELDFSQK